MDSTLAVGFLTRPVAPPLSGRKLKWTTVEDGVLIEAITRFGTFLR
jgi:hypothetical protein